MSNKFKIIETEDYILAVYNEGITIKLRYLYNKIREDIKETYNDFDEKIIAYQPKGNAPELDLPLLPEMVVEDDVSELAEKLFPMNMTGGSISKSDRQLQQNAFKVGYKSATKTFSEEDLRKAFSFGFNEGINYADLKNMDEQPEEISDEDWDVFVKNLKQPKTPKWFVAEMECGENRQCMCESNNDCLKPILKTTTINGKEYLVGKYVNE
jgi:hypothetical protein